MSTTNKTIQQIQQRVDEPKGSRTGPSLPALSDISRCPMSEQAIMTALRAVVANPYYNEFVKAKMLQWPGLRSLAIYNVPLVTNNRKLYFLSRLKSQ